MQVETQHNSVFMKPNGLPKNEYSSINGTYISVAGTHGLIKELENGSNQMVYFIFYVPVLAEKPKKNFLSLVEYFV